MRILETLSWTKIESALGAQAHGSSSQAPRGASIDTRTLEPGDIFFALKGARVDGHEHIPSALEKGAACVVLKDRSRAPRTGLSLIVDDPEKALFELARLVRNRSAAEFVAITGSVGKTTAKEFTAELLRGHGPVLATRGNLNNHLGVPLTLTRLETDHWAAVIECGMSHAGELRNLASLIRPRVAAITNVAAAHLEFFDSIAGIAAAKSEIFDTLGPKDFAVAPADEPLPRERALETRASVRLFGEGDRSSIRASVNSMSLDGSSFQLHAGELQAPITLRVPGPHAISNLLLAASIALALGISIQTVAERAPSLKSGDNRGAVRRLQDDILLIDDTYNSNPKALLSAIETLSLARDRRRVACVGEMLELGATGAALHREAGRAISSRVDLLLGVGSLAREIIEGASFLPPKDKMFFESSLDLAARVADLVKSRDAVLVKGSRGVSMERVVEALVAAHAVIQG